MNMRTDLQKALDITRSLKGDIYVLADGRSSMDAKLALSEALARQLEEQEELLVRSRNRVTEANAA